MKHLASLLVILMSVLAACNHGGGEDSATPRRHAYPRVQTYDSVYTAVDSFPVHFEVNAQAGKRVPRAGWLDVVYPAYGAVMHVSALSYSGQRLEAELEKRRERMTMNLYGLSAATEHVTSADSSFEAVVLVSSDATTTPVQFLATDGHGMLVTGAAYMPGVRPESNADSIAPQVDALHRDILHALKQLSYEVK